MQGSETVVVGTEAPAERTTFDPFGDAARRQGDDFDDLVKDRPAGDRIRPRILSVCRTGAGNRDC
jgi:hypothetical protein